MESTGSRDARPAAGEAVKPKTEGAPGQAIREFEERLKDPMLPDVARYAAKVQRKFPIIIQRAGWAILLIFVLMYAAIGLNGILIFIGGIIVVIIVQLALLFRYIVNENKRAALAREGQEKYLLET